MKKYICMLLAALLACLPMAAMAEASVDQSVIDSFWDTWVSVARDGYATEIWYEDGAFHCRGTRFITVDEGYSFEFKRCTYDAQAKALVCEEGVLLHELRPENAEELTYEEVATGFGATLTVDEKHHLHWTGSGEALPDLEYASLDEVGEESWYDTHDDGESDDGEDFANASADPFVGDWICERASIFIDEDDKVYTVRITWGASAFERAVWEYSCTVDPATGALTGKGKQNTEKYNDNGELIATETVYTDGEATFTIDGDALLWKDAKENVAEGMRFTRVEPEGDAE